MRKTTTALLCAAGLALGAVPGSALAQSSAPPPSSYWSTPLNPAQPAAAAASPAQNTATDDAEAAKRKAELARQKAARKEAARKAAAKKAAEQQAAEADGANQPGAAAQATAPSQADAGQAAEDDEARHKAELKAKQKAARKEAARKAAAKKAAEQKAAAEQEEAAQAAGQAPAQAAAPAAAQQVGAQPQAAEQPAAADEAKPRLSKREQRDAAKREAAARKAEAAARKVEEQTAAQAAGQGGQEVAETEAPAQSRFAALAPLPPVRDVPEEAAAPAEGATVQQASVEPAAPAPQPQPQPQPRQGGFDIVKFFSEASRKNHPERAMPPAGPPEAIELMDRRGRRTAQQDKVARAAVAGLIEKYAKLYDIPVGLADAVVRVESRYNVRARNGPYMGLSQIHPRTARSMGYEGGAEGLLDADTNLRYGMKYLAVAYKLAGGDTCRTILKYQGGHRATTMTRASSVYCARVRTMMASR